MPRQAIRKAVGELIKRLGLSFHIASRDRRQKWGRILEQPEISQYFQRMGLELKSSVATIAPRAGSIEIPLHNEKRAGDHENGILLFPAAY
jgi:hypothetical protein